MKFHCLSIAILLLFLCGCKTTSTVSKVRPNGSSVHEVQYNPGSGLFTFKEGKHPPFIPRDIAKALHKAKIPPGDEILVNMRRFDDQILIAEIAKLLYNGGWTFAFCTDQVAESRGSFMRPLDKPPVAGSPRER